jgi:hypothetical protein
MQSTKKQAVIGARKMQHPEIMTTGEYGPLLYDTIRKYFPDGVKSSGQLEHFLHALHSAAGNEIDPLDTAQGALTHAILAWEDNGKPVYFLEEELARTLTFTEIPVKTFDLGVESVPDNGMYVVLPPLFCLSNSGQQHPIEGFYLVWDVIAVPAVNGKPSFAAGAARVNKADGQRIVSSGSPDYIFVRGITCVGVGRPKGTVPARMREMRDDALVVFHLCPEIPLGAAPSEFGGVPELERVIVNLLYALKNTTSVLSEMVTPVMNTKEAKRRPTKAARVLQDAGKTLNSYRVLSLSKKVRSARPGGSAGPEEPVRKLKHPKYISGHFHRYWVSSPGGERVLAEKDGKGGKLHLVEHLLAPYLQGEDLPPPKTKTIFIKK